MVEEKIAIDASCQTEEWDETHLERYNRMKQSVCALVDVSRNVLLVLLFDTRFFFYAY
jgi:hypothetical protein